MYHPDDVSLCVAGSSAEEEMAHQHPYFNFLSGMNLNTGNYRSGNYPRDEDSMRQLRATCYGLMTEIDDDIGRILALLKETGQYDHTVIVFVSDHGDQLGDPGLLGKGSYFDRSFHIPLIIRLPADRTTMRCGRIIDAFTENVDIPTQYAGQHSINNTKCRKMCNSAWNCPTIIKIDKVMHNDSQPWFLRFKFLTIPKMMW